MTTPPPAGLTVFPALCETSQAALLDHFQNVEWFQRFGKRFPKTAHYNGHHCMLEDPAHSAVLKPIVLEAIAKAMRHCSHPALEQMAANPSEVAVATMKHEPGWGLGAHVDVYAPKGRGLVLMVTVADTQRVHRTFRFSQPETKKRYDIPTPSGLGIVFCDAAYEQWLHESVKNKKQDGTCISLTIRLREIDGYDGWQIPETVVDDATRVGIPPKRYRSHAFAEEQRQLRVKLAH